MADWRTHGEYFPCVCGHAKNRHRVTWGKFECGLMRDDASACPCQKFQPCMPEGKPWAVVLVSHVVLEEDGTRREYIESTHRWKWQAVRAMRRHRLWGRPTWSLKAARPGTSVAHTVAQNPTKRPRLTPPK